MADHKIILPEVSEIAPEPPPKGPRVWMRDNLFYSPASAVLTVIGAAIAIMFLRGMFSFALAPERKWEAITTNFRLLMVQAYPQGDTWRMWVALGSIFVLLALSFAFWRVDGKLAPRKIGRAVAGTGGFVAFVVLIAPFSSSARIFGVVFGVVLLVAGLSVERILGEQSKEETVPVLLVGLVITGLIVGALWVVKVPIPDPAAGQGESMLQGIARTTSGPWTLIWLAMIVAYFVGVLLRRVVPDRIGRFTLGALWALAFPVIVLHLSRGVEFHNVGLYVSIGIGFIIIGGAIIWFLADPASGEVGRGLAGLILVLAVLSWVIPEQMHTQLILVRILLLLLALFALAGPTFAGAARQTRLRYLAVWTVVVIVVVYFMLLSVGDSLVQTQNETVYGGFFLTWILAIGSIALSFPLGVILALGRTSTMPIFRLLSTLYIEIIRGVPLITWLLVSVVVFPFLFPPGVTFVDPVKVLLFITFFSAAYLAENVRGGLQAISKGQTEAANALGMTTLQRTVFITLPQALRAVIPALVGQVIAIFKDTSLVAIVGLFDLLRIGRNVIPNQTQPFNFLGSMREALLAVAIIYWIFTFIFSRVSLRLEERLGVGAR